jgi:CHAT domain-containing protein
LRGIESLPADLGHQDEFKDIFLAGNPLSAEDNLPALPTAADELANVEYRFPEARVSKVEGSDLTMASFRSDALTSADLVHIASHARIDLVYPELSRLTLSSGKFHEEFFSPHDLANLQLTANLVVLSACETVGDNRFQFDNNLGFVSGFLKSGAAAVVASLWPVSDRGALQWSDNFYQLIAAGHTSAMALARTKRQMINAAERDSGTDHWSTFQIFMQ